MTDDIQDELQLHEPVTEDNCFRALEIFLVPPVYEHAYDWLVKFFKPDEWELPLVEKCAKSWCVKSEIV